ncbi:hypothetical protein WJX72_002671 [[Myrmecia] bisecta]|uniref:Uncharacterized protein n=1 Tax=[Myrmecia] bisecta TaxID=41462 RepID=A0AAW1QQS1_9CHLO
MRCKPAASGRAGLRACCAWWSGLEPGMSQSNSPQEAVASYLAAHGVDLSRRPEPAAHHSWQVEQAARRASVDDIRIWVLEPSVQQRQLVLQEAGSAPFWAISHTYSQDVRQQLRAVHTCSDSPCSNYVADIEQFDRVGSAHGAAMKTLLRLAQGLMGFGCERAWLDCM